MTILSILPKLPILLVLIAPATTTAQSSDWIPLFDGETLSGWKAGENEGTFRVEDGTIVAHGPRAHLFYVGPVANHSFRNFEFETEVKTRRCANSGIYFHTAFQRKGFPTKGYEVQVNNSHLDRKRTGGLYSVRDIRSKVAKDNEWFTLRIRVEGKRIRTFVNDSLIVDFTESVDFVPPKKHPQRKLGNGTFAIQGHDRFSKVAYRNLRVRLLPD